MNRPVAFVQSLLPDQTLYSWCGHYHRLAGNATVLATRTQLFGAPTLGTSFHFLTHLDAFSARTLVGVSTHRGFTDHEHLDEVGLIHMNGRIYDPALGRFMSADPYVQSPDNLQSYNRYTYGWNNPLSGYDPTGYGWFSDFVGAWHDLWNDPLIHTVASVVAAYYTAQFVGASCPGCLGWGQAAGAAAGGFAGGMVADGTFASGMQGAVTAEMFFRVGSAFDFKTEPFPNALGHAAVGCISGAMSGATCGRGALSAAAGAAWTNYYGYKIEDKALGLLTTSIVGGTASVLGGGKFDNGAQTAAFGYLFNYCAHATFGCALEWGYNAGKVVMGVLGIDAAVAACAGTEGIVCGPAVSLAAWGANSAVEGATYFSAPDYEGMNPAKFAMESTSTALTGNPAYGTYAYDFASLGMNVWSAGTATQIWLETPKLGGGWLTTGYAWQSMSSTDKLWLLYDTGSTAKDTMAPQK